MMATTLPRLFLARHGDTARTDAHKHTGRTDVPLNERGEASARQIGERRSGDVLAFSSGHAIRMIAARWLRLPPHAGRAFYCEPASVGVLGFEHYRRDEPVLRLWNQVAKPGKS